MTKAKLKYDASGSEITLNPESLLKTISSLSPRLMARVAGRTDTVILYAMAARIEAGECQNVLADSGFRVKSDDDPGVLREIVEQLESCKFECEAGRLENNVGFRKLRKMAGLE